jgi:CRISPR-associated protein Csm4
MLLRFSFRPLSPFKHFPESFTLFGAICWGVRVLYGEDELEKMLEAFLNEPPFIISSPLFEKNGKLLFPKPILKDDWGDITSR